MGLEGEIFASAATAALTGNVGEFGTQLDYLVQKHRIDAATLSGGTDVHVDLDALVDFYNRLSDLHRQLVQQRNLVLDAAGDVQSADAGGKVPGVQQAWKTIGLAAGLNNAAASLTGNIAHVDSIVLDHMASLKHNAEQYAAHEDATIVGLGKAADTGAASTIAPAAASPAPGGTVSSSTLGYGGR